MQQLQNIPITGPSGAPPQILGDVASLSRTEDAAVVSHYDVEPVVDIFGSVDGRDLGGALIEALGGGWNAAQLPSMKAVASAPGRAVMCPAAP